MVGETKSESAMLHAGIIGRSISGRGTMGFHMIHDIQKPEISPQFTIEDIHKILEWNYEHLKNAIIQERIAEIRGQA
jgi:hypothetical protein